MDKLSKIDEKPRRPGGRLLTPAQAAEHLGLPQSTLARWRSEKRGPEFFKLEGVLVRYSASDLDEWLAKSRVSTGTNRSGD